MICAFDVQINSFGSSDLMLLFLQKAIQKTFQKAIVLKFTSFLH